MRNYVTSYWLFVVAGIVISFILSNLIHSFLDKPRGIPLARLGVEGTVTQIGLIVFPLLFAPILTSLAFFGSNQRKPTRIEYQFLIASVAGSALVLWVLVFAGSGAWFWVFQGDFWFVVACVLGPPIAATIAFWVLFPLGIRIILLRIRK